MMKSLFWKDIIKNATGKVEYRVCSEYISWRPANNFHDYHSALFREDGAFNMFHSFIGLRVEEQRDKYGNPYYCAVWIEDHPSGGALLTDGNELVLVSHKMLSSIDKSSVYNYKKWDKNKKSIEVNLALNTKKQLDYFFQESSDRISFAEESFESLLFCEQEQPSTSIIDISNSKATSDIVNDIFEFLEISTKNTESLALVKSRVGQGQFRSKLIDYWGACSVTGCATIPLLKASHIKPCTASTNSERLDVYNGLLLVPGIDAAFDYGLITFLPNGKSMISNALPVNDRLSLGILTLDICLGKVEKHHLNI